MPHPIKWFYKNNSLTDGTVALNPSHYTATSAAKTLKMSWQNAYNMAQRLDFKWKPKRLRRYDLIESELIALEQLGEEWAIWVDRYRNEEKQWK